MILTCPHCSTRYLLPAAAISSVGREVRCAKCDSQWFQSSTDDELEHEEPESIIEATLEEEKKNDPIPEGVKPDHSETENVPAFAKDVVRPPISLQAKMAGYGASILMFAIILTVFIGFKTSIVQSWPASQAIYELAGLDVDYKGQELVIESLAAQIIDRNDGPDTLLLKGRVTNLTDKAISVPKMAALLRTTNGEDGEKWIIDAPVDQVESGASFSFTSEYAGVPSGMGSVNLTFTPELAGI